MDTPSIPYRVHQCSKCPGDTEYYCVSCPCDLCPKCNENHVKDLKTIDHNVLSYREIFNYIPTQEICVKHPNMFYGKYCVLCEVPACNTCICGKQRKNKKINVTTAYKTKKQQHEATIHTIRSEVLIYRPPLLPKIKSDFQTCHTTFSLYQSEMLTKATKLKEFIDYIQYDFIYNVLCDFDFKHRCLKQKIEMNRHIDSLQRYVHRYEQRVVRPLQFLSSIKTALLQINLTVHTCQLFMTESLNKEDIMESLSAVQITERGNRRVKNECLLKQMSAPELHQSLTVTDVDGCYHISFVTLDRVVVSDNSNIVILRNSTVETLHRVKDSCKSFDGSYGLHSMNSESELIYIDRNSNINKLSKEMKTTSTFIKRTDSTWRPRCVYLSPSTGDLLVGMYRLSIAKCYIDEYIVTEGNVTRYNQSGQLTQIIQDITGWGLYFLPNYITENNNGDVVVSDSMPGFGAVVVTERGGKHRFSYTGHPSGSKLEPRGICTDALSHILVCEDRSKTVQMIDKDGHFLSYLLTYSQEIGKLLSLSYDLKTHRLWVGSYNNKACVYRYITRQDALTDQSHVMESLSGISTQGAEKLQKGNNSLLKLMSSPELLHSLTQTGVNGCYHISCVTSDRVWISDYSNLILTNTTIDTLHRVKDSSGDLNYNGRHTVNSESELFYIDRIYNIKKLSKNMKITTTFIKRTDFTWRPWCVYCSLSTGDLLVGMRYLYANTGILTRYNQSGQLTQTIQHDNTGRGLYNRPNYITENNNGDVVVSDSMPGFGAVVVTERGGKHRFSYTGYPSGSGLRPRGICTDALSHILVCADWTNTVQILDQDGQFLSHLPLSPSGIFLPYSLSYDTNTHRLWVGLDNSKVYVYRYITRQDALTDEHTPQPDGEALSNSTPAVEGR